MENLLSAVPGNRGDSLRGALAGPQVLARRRGRRDRQRAEALLERFGLDGLRQQLRRRPQRRPAAAGGDHARADGRAASAAARRADGRRAPEPGPADRERARRAVRRGADRADGRARAGHHGRVLRPRDGDGRGRRARRGHHGRTARAAPRSWRHTLSAEHHTGSADGVARGAGAAGDRSDRRLRRRPGDPRHHACTSSPARSSRSSAPTARARAPCSRAWSAWCGVARARSPSGTGP